MLVWHAAAFTHHGRVRTANEDGIAIEGRILTGDMAAPITLMIANDVSVLMIADGMGGHHHGAVASRAVLDHLVADVERLASPATCTDAICEANDHLYELMDADPRYIGMGATLIGAVLTPTQMTIFNAGDSRGYLHSHNVLIQISHDHVPDMCGNRLGRCTHAVTQALGGSCFHASVEPHVNVEPPLRVGETLLICSDGLTDMVSDRVIQDVLSRTVDIDAAARTLVARAFYNGGADNISLVLVRRKAVGVSSSKFRTGATS